MCKMDLIFEPQKGRPFTIEVGFFDSILEIKEKVQKHQGIPVSDQTLVFEGQVLPDDGDIASCILVHNSIINLIISKKIVLLRAKIPIPVPHLVTIEMYANDTVLYLKKKILEAHRMTLSAYNLSVMVLRFKGQELQDSRTLRECGVSDHDTATELSFKLIKVIVKTQCGTRWSTVEVHPFNRVWVLRKELMTLNRAVGFPLPLQYFFVHEQSAMKEDKSFWWHHVGHGDSIVVFPGRVTSRVS